MVAVSYLSTETYSLPAQFTAYVSLPKFFRFMNQLRAYWVSATYTAVCFCETFWKPPHRCTYRIDCYSLPIICCQLSGFEDWDSTTYRSHSNFAFLSWYHTLRSSELYAWGKYAFTEIILADIWFNRLESSTRVSFEVEASVCQNVNIEIHSLGSIVVAWMELFGVWAFDGLFYICEAHALHSPSTNTSDMPIYGLDSVAKVVLVVFRKPAIRCAYNQTSLSFSTRLRWAVKKHATKADHSPWHRSKSSTIEESNAIDSVVLFIFSFLELCTFWDVANHEDKSLNIFKAWCSF